MKRFLRKIFNANPYPDLKSGEEAMEIARRQGYTMIKWNRMVYAVPSEGVKWDSLPLFSADDLSY